MSYDELLSWRGPYGSLWTMYRCGRCGAAVVEERKGGDEETTGRSSHTRWHGLSGIGLG